MSWTTPGTWSTGQIVTAAQLNTDIRDNENFLYSGLNAITLGTTANVLNTNYQNTTGMIKFVLVTVSTDTGITMVGYAGSTSPASRVVSSFHTINTGFPHIATASFFVPPSFYYSVSTSAGAEVLSKWTESNLHAT